MKINDNFIVKNIAGEIVLIPTGNASQYFNGLISTNSVAGFIWEHMESCSSPEEMVQLVIKAYDVEEKRARKEVLSFLDTLKIAGMIE